jgi:CRP-like cAMP-binding protein
MTRFAALRAVRELAACSDVEISSLLRFTDEVNVSGGVVVAERERLCAAFVVVVEGSLRAGCDQLQPGDSFGWDAMWERTANPATLVAQLDARLLVMSHEQFRAVKGHMAPGVTTRLRKGRVPAAA